jgi:hypothetical protein
MRENSDSNLRRWEARHREVQEAEGSAFPLGNPTWSNMIQHVFWETGKRTKKIYNDFVSFFGKLTLFGSQKQILLMIFRRFNLHLSLFSNDIWWGKGARIEASKHQQTRSTRKTGEKHKKISTAQEFAGPSQWWCDFVRNTMRPMGWKPRIGKGKRKGSWKCPPESWTWSFRGFGVSYGFISCEFVQFMTCSGRRE